MTISPEGHRLAEMLQELDDGLYLVVTGAGTSHASGIPTFRGRDPEAVWSHHDIEMATFEFFRRDPVEQWRWYLERFRHIDGARPNPAHHALRDLESWQAARGGELLVVTQNIDCLHEAAGTRNLIKVHGSSDRLRCVSWSCEMAAPRGSLSRESVDLEAFRQRPDRDTLPRCPSCGGLLRAHVLFFDEYYAEHVDYRFDDVEAAAASCDLALFVGTSFSVGVTELVLRSALARGTPVVSIDPGGQPTGPGLEEVIRVREDAEQVLPEICSVLGT